MRAFRRVHSVAVISVAAACVSSSPNPICHTPAIASGPRADTTFQQPAPPATIRGFVVDRETGRPLAESYVRIRALARAMKTDTLGHFVFSDIAPGQHELQALRLGWFPATEVVTISTDSGATAVLVQIRDTTTRPCVTVSGATGTGTRKGIARVPSNDTLKPSGAAFKEVVGLYGWTALRTVQ